VPERINFNFWPHPDPEFPPSISLPSDSEGREIKVEIEETQFSTHRLKILISVEAIALLVNAGTPQYLQKSP